MLQDYTRHIGFGTNLRFQIKDFKIWCTGLYIFNGGPLCIEDLSMETKAI